MSHFSTVHARFSRLSGPITYDNTTYTGGNLVSGTFTVQGELAVDSSSGLTTNQATFPLLDVVPTRINFGGNATTIDIGASTGTTTVKNDFVVDGSFTLATAAFTGNITIGTDGSGDIIAGTGNTTFGIVDTIATTINFGGEATTINMGAATGTFTVLNATLDVDGVITAGTAPTTLTSASGQLLGAAFESAIAGTGLILTAGVLDVVGGTNITANANDIQLSTNVDVAGTLDVTGATTLDSTLAATGVSTFTAEIAADSSAGVTTNQATFSLVDAVTTQIDFGGAATTVNIGAATGTCNLLNATTAVAGALTVVGDITLSGADIITDDTTFNCFNTTATTVNAFGAASTALNLGHASGTTTVAGALTVTGLATLSANLIGDTNWDIGPSDDTDLLNLQSDALTVNGSLTATGTTLSLSAGDGTDTTSRRIAFNTAANASAQQQLQFQEAGAAKWTIYHVPLTDNLRVFSHTNSTDEMLFTITGVTISKDLLILGFVQCDAQIHIAEISTPTAITNYGAIYTKTDNALYFQDGAGAEHLVLGESFSQLWFHSATVSTVTISTALAFTTMTSFANVGNEDSFSNMVASSSNNNIVVGTNAAGQYQISYSMSCTIAGGATKEIIYAVRHTRNSALAITNATNATPIVLTITSNVLQNGDMLVVTGVGGNTAANGDWIADSVSGDSVTLLDLSGANSVGNGAYTSGGTVPEMYPGDLVTHLELSNSDLIVTASTSVHQFFAGDDISLVVVNIDDTSNLSCNAVSLSAQRIHS